MQVSLEHADSNLILSLLAQLKKGNTAAAAPPAAPPPAAPEKPSSHEPAAKAAWRAERAAEALAAEKAERHKDRERSALLKEAFRDDAVASAATARQAAAALPTTGSVRITLCGAERPSDRKLVVLRRAPDIDELLKVGKAKLRLKKALSARLLDGGATVGSTAELHDGAVVALSAEPPPPPPPPPPPQQQQQPPPQQQQQQKEEEGKAEDEGVLVRPPAEASAPRPRTEQRTEPRGHALPQRAVDAAAAAAEQSRLAAACPPEAMVRARAALPVTACREQLMRAVGSSTAMVVQGEPGCGKSTGVPQLLLESLVAAGRGGDAAIVVAQPRRVSAMSLAMRVAEERGERVGGTVGFAVRGEVRAGAETRILYCTTGWLLKQLSGCLVPREAAAPDAAGEGAASHGASAAASRGGSGWERLHRLSHVIVDEVSRAPRCVFGAPPDAPPPFLVGRSTSAAC